MSLVVGHTGINAPTTNMVAGVASRRASDPGIDEAMEAIAGLVHRGLEALKTGDSEALGRTMTENHLLLRRIGVSHPKLETLVSAALPTSLGAKLTGAGGGGCMIALTRDAKATSEAIELAGGRTWITALGTPVHASKPALKAGWFTRNDSVQCRNGRFVTGQQVAQLDLHRRGQQAVVGRPLVVVEDDVTGIS